MKSIIINFLLFSGLFYFLYVLLFRNKSFFELNRWLLLSIPVFSLIIPILAPYFNDPVYISTGFSTTLLPEVIIQPQNQEVQQTGNPAYWWAIYALGALVGSFLFLRGMLRINTIIKHSEKNREHNIEFAFSTLTNSPFSFFRHIIIPPSLKDDKDLITILTHEKVHQTDRHSYDNLYYSLLGIVFWFNPFIHLLAKELRQTHECIADRKAIKETSREVYAHMLLSSTFGGEVALPANPFFNPSLLKTRITMLYKNETPKWLKLSYLALLPLAVAMTLHACNKAPESVEAANVKKSQPVNFNEVEQPPLFEDCDATASADDQRICFKQGITKFIIANLQYPKDAYELGVEGKVFISFVINEEGETEDVKIARGVSLAEGASAAELDAAKSLEDYALALIGNFPKLSPAQKDGKSISMEFKLPISYKMPVQQDTESVE